jgi:pimeloyl-ACP methyl ester carboxylesterase
LDNPSVGQPQPDRSHWVLGISRRGFHRVAYVEWGNPNAERVAVCVHGLSRQGRDFDRLAASMAAQGWRVICPDLAGRGRSDWLRNPDEYNLPQYAMDLTALIARLGVTEVDWIGTSLGGLIGIVLAGQDKSPIRSLVVNDIGPFLPWQALHRLGNSVRNTPKSFPDLAAAIGYYRTMLAPFGPLTDDEWQHLAVHSVGESAGGVWRMLCDPGITAAFRPGLFFNLSLWTYWDAITCPTLVLRGAESDLLLPMTLKEMARRGPRAATVEFPGCGHAPALMDAGQIETVTRWLHTVIGSRM